MLVASLKPIRKWSVPLYGTYMLALVRALCEGEMRLMGTDRLHAIATGADPAVASAAACLCAELAAARWSNPEEARADFPKAVTRGSKLEIPLDDENRVVLLVNYRLATILVEFAGPVGAATAILRKTRKNA